MRALTDRLNVAAMWYPVRTLGFGDRLGVWVQGCARSCMGCISPEFRPYTERSLLTPEEILSRLPEGITPDGLTISGGEPFDQAECLLELIRLFGSRFSDDILVYTGYTLEELRDMRSPAVDGILGSISVLIDGEYVEELNDGRPLRGSSNQRIHVFRNSERYAGCSEGSRGLQGVLLDDRIWFIGIPPAMNG